MSRHHPSQILPFSPDIDRNYFGAYISGFTDGEGCFILRYCRYSNRHSVTPTPACHFQICLRADDAHVLELIRSYFGCGYISINNASSTHGPYYNKPQATYKVHKIAEVATIVAPHFEKFPLLAKKSLDYAIWKQAVCLTYAISQRRRCNGSGRFATKWTPGEREQFHDLFVALKAQRKYQAARIQVRDAQPDIEPDHNLFGYCGF